MSEHRDATKFLDVHDFWFHKSTPSTRLAVATPGSGVKSPRVRWSVNGTPGRVGYVCEMTPYSDECHRIIPGAWWAASEVRFPVTCMTVKLVRYWILDILIGFYSEYQCCFFGIGMSNIGLYSEYQCCFFGIGMSNIQHFCKR